MRLKLSHDLPVLAKYVNTRENTLMTPLHSMPVPGLRDSLMLFPPLESPMKLG